MKIEYIYAECSNTVVGRRCDLPDVTVTMFNNGKTSVYFSDNFYPTNAHKQSLQSVISRYRHSVICDETFIKFVTDIRLCVESSSQLPQITTEYFGSWLTHRFD